MQLPWKALARKAGGWLRDRITEEVQKEVATQLEKRTGPTPPPVLRPPRADKDLI